MRIKFVWILLFGMLLCGGCATEAEKQSQQLLEKERQRKGVSWAEMKRQYLASENILPKVAAAIKEGRAIKGMSPDEVSLAWERFPAHSNKSVGSWGEREQLVFDGYAFLIGSKEEVGSRAYLYFNNGSLDSWQISR